MKTAVCVEQFGIKFFSQMMKTGLNIIKLAMKSEVDRGTIGKCRRGVVPSSEKVRRRLAAGLGVPFEEFESWWKQREDEKNFPALTPGVETISTGGLD